MSIYEYRPMLVFCVVVAAALGAALGSFLNCAAWRIVRGESFLSGRSHCAVCGHPLSAAELIPLWSWALQRGRCKWCGEKISIRYPLTEMLFSLLTVLCLLRFDLTPLGLRNWLFLCVLFLLTLTDLDDMIIPDGCHIAAVVIWALFLPFTFTGWRDVGLSLLSAVLYGGGLMAISLVMDKAMGRDTLGGGDIKLFAVVGLYLGLVGTLFAVALACVFGLLFHTINTGKDKAFPFGPSIAVAPAVMLLYGAPLVRWYTGLLG